MAPALGWMNWLKSFVSGKKKQPFRKENRRYRPQLEQLEDRVVLTVVAGPVVYFPASSLAATVVYGNAMIATPVDFSPGEDSDGTVTVDYATSDGSAIATLIQTTLPALEAQGLQKLQQIDALGRAIAQARVTNPGDVPALSQALDQLKSHLLGIFLEEAASSQQLRSLLAGYIGGN